MKPSLLFSAILLLVFIPLITFGQTVLVVTTEKDTIDPNDGKLSLREAIATSDQTTGRQIIQFDPLVFSTAAKKVIALKSEIVATDLAGVIVTGAGASVIIDGGEPPIGSGILPDAILFNGLVLKGGTSSIDHLTIQNFGLSGIVIDTLNSGSCIVGPANVFLNCRHAAIEIQTSNNNTITGNFISNCGGGSATTLSVNYYWPYDAILVYDNCTGTIIEKNKIQENFSGGIGVYGSSNTTIRQNIIASNSDDGLWIDEGKGGNVVESNIVVGSGYDGIALSGTANINNAVRLNKIGDSTTVAVSLRNRKTDANSTMVNASGLTKRQDKKFQMTKKGGAQDISAQRAFHRKPRVADPSTKPLRGSGVEFAQAPGSNGDDGIGLYGVGYTAIEDNFIYASGYAGVYIEGIYDSLTRAAHHIMIQRNKITWSDESAIEFYDVKDITIRENACVHNYYGIYGENYPDDSLFTSNALIEYNHLENGWSEAVYLNEFTGVKTLWNYIARYETGIELGYIKKAEIGMNGISVMDYEGIEVYYVDSVFIHHNRVINTWDDGLYMYHDNDSTGYAEIWENEFRDCDYYGMDIYDIGTIKAHNNVITDCYYGNYFDYHRNLLFSQNRIIGCKYDHLEAYDIANAEILNNEMLGSYDDEAVDFGNIIRCLIKGNTVKDAGSGIYAYNMDSVWFEGNKIHNTKGYGFDCERGTDIQIVNNEFHSNLYSGLYVSNFRNVRVEGNNFTLNNEEGAELNYCRTVNVRGNTFLENYGDGLDASNDSLLIVEGNFFQSNYAGIYVSNFYKKESKIIGNTIQKHTWMGLYNSSVLPLHAENNYWGHVSGPLNANDDDTLHLTNLGGGDEVSENVCFMPFSTTPPYSSAMKPALVSVDPQTSPRAGGGKAAVHGRQMLPGAKVFFGKDTIKTVSYIASDALGITIPSGRGGPVDVIVKNPNGQVDTLRRGFFYDNNPPLAFQLSDPTAGKIVTVAKPTFRWKKTSDPDGDEIVYLFVLSDRDDFADSILVEGLKDTVYTLKDTSLASSKQYYWKVIASDTREGYAVSPVGIFATGIITNAGQEVEIPKEFALYQNYPNPFNPSTTISFALPLASRVVIKIYDIVGREVATLIKGELAAGLYRYPFNGSGYSSGMYIYRMSAISVQNGNEQTFTSVKKLLLVK